MEDREGERRSDKIRIHILGRTLITTSATKNDAGAAVGGVGILLNKNAENSLASVRSHKNRIRIANFQGNPATPVIVTYCPTNIADEDIVENHNVSMRRAIESIPAHNLLITMGDFNARVGLEDAKFTYHDTTNRNGKYLVELATAKNLIIANTQFRKKVGTLWTYSSPGGNKYQLDYILMKKMEEHSVGSDHRIVSARIRLSLRMSTTLPRKNQFDWKSLSTDRNIQKMYAIEVHNRFEILENIEETATDKYSRFIAANKEAAEKIIPAKKRSRRANFSRDPRVIKAREHIRETYEAYQLDTTDLADCKREEYKEAKKNLDDAYNKVIEGDLNVFKVA
ncbi:craniofacial development protein 2-like [Amphiura filiformis]|uniref:craniofacial development protein 2-like n=1 Tax=Amphiura filiformis TaxID=82378 RepID=UPI003B2159F7